MFVTIDTIPASGCKFPVTGHDVAASEHRFCGVKTGGVYCSYHASLAYTPYADRRREQRDKRSFAQRSAGDSRFNPAWS